MRKAEVLDILLGIFFFMCFVGCIYCPVGSTSLCYFSDLAAFFAGGLLVRSARLK